MKFIGLAFLVLATAIATGAAAASSCGEPTAPSELKHHRLAAATFDLARDILSHSRQSGAAGLLPTVSFEYSTCPELAPSTLPESRVIRIPDRFIQKVEQEEVLDFASRTPEDQNCLSAYQQYLAALRKSENTASIEDAKTFSRHAAECSQVSARLPLDDFVRVQSEERVVQILAFTVLHEIGHIYHADGVVPWSGISVCEVAKGTAINRENELAADVFATDEFYRAGLAPNVVGAIRIFSFDDGPENFATERVSFYPTGLRRQLGILKRLGAHEDGLPPQARPLLADFQSLQDRVDQIQAQTPLIELDGKPARCDGL